MSVDKFSPYRVHLELPGFDVYVGVVYVCVVSGLMCMLRGCVLST